MEDELENFIRERKARVLEDKAYLGPDPPYMEIKAKPCEAYGSTFKESPPHIFTTQEKDINGSVLQDDTCVVGLPLGVDYEKKKKKLQHELRMDYRRYMTQRKHFNSGDPGSFHLCDNRTSIKQPLEGQAVFPQQLRLQSDAATLTEDGRLFKEDTGPSPVLLTHPDWRQRPEREFRDELLLTQGRTHAEDKSQSRKRDGGDERDKPGAHMMEGRRLRALGKTENAEFLTGLIIGAADTCEALQKRKERYRRELEEQIAEQHRNKKREKDLELKVAATGANDPEKQPDRIRQFGLSKRKGPPVSQLSAPQESGSSSKAVLYNEETEANGREMPRLLPHVAFPSPLLEYSSSLSRGDGGPAPNSPSDAPHSFHSDTDMARNPVFFPRPSVSEAYRNLNGESHHYYKPRNTVDPSIPYYERLALPGAGFPVSYWTAPYGGAVPSQFGHQNHHTQHSGCTFPESAVHRSNKETAFVDPHVGSFPPERPRSTRDNILNYRDALKQQIQEQQERKCQEREEAAQYEARLEADMRNHLPWGRGGGGAPLKDSSGNLFADLNQMHKLNEEAYSKPEQWLRRAREARQAEPLVPECSNHDTADRLPGFTHVQTPQFPRCNVFANHPNKQRLQEQDKYKAYLKQQIEEKMCKKAKEREQIRMEEEKEEKRLAEQRARIQREYEEEQERKKQKQMEQKAKNEELIQLAEQTKKEAEKKRMEMEEKENAALLRQYESKRQTRVEVHREPSPPIPALQKKPGHHWGPPRPPTVESQRSTAPMSDRSLSGLQSPPVPACRNQLRAAGDTSDVFSGLSALRRQLQSEQKRLESHLEQGDWEELDSPMSIRPREYPAVDVFDMARLRLQAPVRRPNSNVGHRNPFHVHDNLPLKYTDAGLRLGCRDDGGLEDRDGASRRSQDDRDSYQRFSSQRSTAQDDYFDLSPPEQRDDLRSVSRGSTGGLLLESDSAFIDPLGDACPAAHTPELEAIHRQLSARERRRLAKRSQGPQNRAPSSRASGHRSDCFTYSSEKQEAGRGPRGAPSEDSPFQPSPYSFDHRSSLETLATDPWMRPRASGTLKRLNQALRRERLIT
ncbi:centrosome and spindle pole-associated protein 1-like isoform X3 [Cololabis saira]|uniref:centrosome and spindle pole-associated protein 1-like isoform X3 n=1 Tax=Cololabis saira TaxID=129043 RepID=UPI002AD463AE|nr:centrosome and spindle pole-associated protein 1-like isoform X3 [Cololabis saira]